MIVRVVVVCEAPLGKISIELVGLDVSEDTRAILERSLIFEPLEPVSSRPLTEAISSPAIQSPDGSTT